MRIRILTGPAATAALLLSTATATEQASGSQPPSKRGAARLICNGDHSTCVHASIQDQPVTIPFTFLVEVKCPREVSLDWELQDDTGQVLDNGVAGPLPFLLARKSATERTIEIRDFLLKPAKSQRGVLHLHPSIYGSGSENVDLPSLAIPLRLDMGTSTVTFAIPASETDFSQAVIDSVESDPAHPVPMRAKVAWRSQTVMRVRPGSAGGAAAEASARYGSGQSPWHIVNYLMVGGIAHVTVLGDGWAGVSYYLCAFDYLVEKTVEHQPGVQHIDFDKTPDFGQ
jgi:hypothetical protein